MFDTWLLVSGAQYGMFDCQYLAPSMACLITSLWRPVWHVWLPVSGAQYGMFDYQYLAPSMACLTTSIWCPAVWHVWLPVSGVQYGMKIWLINGVDNINCPPYRHWKTDVSSVSSVVWANRVIVGSISFDIQKKELRYWWELGNVKSTNELIECKAFVDAVGIKGADLRNESLLTDFCGNLWYPDVRKGRN